MGTVENVLTSGQIAEARGCMSAKCPVRRTNLTLKRNRNQWIHASNLAAERLKKKAR